MFSLSVFRQRQRRIVTDSIYTIRPDTTVFWRQIERVNWTISLNAPPIPPTRRKVKVLQLKCFI